MSQFDSYTQANYVRHLSTYLGKRHPATQLMLGQKPEKRKGRPPLRSDDVVHALEVAVNAKAVRCEATDSTCAERVTLGMAYAGLRHTDVAQALSVSREAVRQWAAGTAYPKQLERLAEVLAVPFDWLKAGGERYLPADSSLGVRVGAANREAREDLYELTIAVLAEAPDFDNAVGYIALLEEAVYTNPRMAVLARRAGGRWQMHGDSLTFAPWIPLAPHGLSRRYWTDEVEAIIDAALACSKSVYSGWHEVKRRCEERGLAYSQLVSLQKRGAKQKARVAKFGMDLNSEIKAACAQVR